MPEARGSRHQAAAAPQANEYLAPTDPHIAAENHAAVHKTAGSVVNVDYTAAATAACSMRAGNHFGQRKESSRSAAVCSNNR